MTEPVIAYAIRICNKFHSDVIMWFYYSVSLHVPTRHELQDWCHQSFYFPTLCLLGMAESNSYVAEYLFMNEILPH